ncbi:type II/IV secretion system ATPase subunit [Nitrosopumilus sp.]|uniref:type II/IV secretion system ATPase subunit n=1 Tax=Nitrosopumilus sp. TaxID=2024843 RepID=UPI00262B9BA4|nr:type II/IV secretion system ATPase subunit [Nitrosopumilus sp.]
MEINKKIPFKTSEKTKDIKNKKSFKKSQFKSQSKNSPFSKIQKMLTGSALPKKSNLKFILQNLTVSSLENYEIIKTYPIGECTIYIAKDNTGKLSYMAQEPEIDEGGKRAYTQIMNYLFVSLTYEINEKEKNLEEFVRKRILEIGKELGMFRKTALLIEELTYYAIRDSFGYGIIDVLMHDPNIEDISEENFLHPVGVAHREFGDFGLLDTNIRFYTMESANSFVQKLVQKTEKSMTAAIPYIDTMTKQGHRIAATFGKEVSLPGPNFTIRKFTEEPITIVKLLQFGTLDLLIAAYVWLLLESKAFVLVTGSTSAGKTTTIGALNSLINPQMKITTIEDTPELKINHRHWQKLITRKTSSLFEDKYEITMDDLIRLSLRSRPDYIIVGEVRGEEISSLIQAVATGHGGLTSFHASSPESAFVRMESPPMNVHVGGQMLISVILQQNRLVDAHGNSSRRIIRITEVIPKDNKVSLETIFEWNAEQKRFLPNNVLGVVKKSARLAEIALTNGWKEEDLIAELVIRMAYLNNMREKGIVKFEDVSKEFEKFYFLPMERYKILLESTAEFLK